MKNQRNRHSKVYAVVLAAGEGRRFAGNKQLALLDGEPLVRRAAHLAQAVCGENSLLVTGFESEHIFKASDGYCSRVTCNERFASGIGSSIARAAEILADKASALLIILADQPLITEEHLDALLQRWSGSDTHIVASSYGDTRGAPVLLPDGCFPDLLRLDGDRGAKVLFDNPRFTTESIDFAPAAVDVDTVEDLARLTQPSA